MPTPYLHKNISVSLLRYHFVWCPKRRRKVLIGNVALRLKELLEEKTAAQGWEIVALEIMPDHVHLCLGTDPDVSPTQVMHALKGYTSRVLRQEFPKLQTMPSLWTRSYWVSTAGNVSAEVIQRYIAEQKTRD
ncbi:IS200/IS605 family transposase [Deinococcus radiopugnans]|uniref:Transposase n=1 Tax=Deinococcus radiopugnans ATCC 19172 TaxID=585398 RepID=A0A5C4Y788_9DEIO|nr:IS200/IS605 family transposase [Deinococcus radiopugnans]MBB6017792.1 putative transposase [Deinococcus radiopugnans ATCC 19172]QLG11537.1 IS200/IS605 family transposase [Deinococcus sp. D7000]TNM71410.1 IS200/IS605 family transposase [Deinococcus radiopugnans ATCC 19172]